MRKGDEWKAAFATNRGLFEPKVMFFGLTNSPATFQALMNSLFADLIAAGKVAVYLDDILIFTRTLEEHRQVVRKVLEILQKNDLYLKPDKCLFDVEEVEFFRLIVKPDTLAMDPVKLKGIEDWPEPSSVKGVRSFLGFANFYQRFIPNYSELTRPLHELTK